MLLLFCEQNKRRYKHIAGKSGKNHLLNDEIRFPRVRLLDAEGEMVGVVNTHNAMQMAEEAGLDLVLISPQPDNPVCRLMDYSKFNFEQAKREREAKRNQKVTVIKEVQLRLATDTHDIDVKTKTAKRFLADGDRVKVVLKFRGREMTRTNMGLPVMDGFAEKCSDVCDIDKAPRVEGRNMVMYLAPKKENRR